MEKMTTVMNTIICIVVVVMLVVTTIIPVIDDASDPQTTVFNNEDWYYANLVGTTGTHTLEFDVESATPIISDGETIVIDSSAGRIPTVITDTVSMWPNTTFTALAAFSIAPDSISLILIKSVDITIDAAAKTITLENIVNSDSESIADITYTYGDFCYLIGTTGDYAAMAPNETAKEIYVSGTDNIFALWAAPEGYIWALGDDGYSFNPLSNISIGAELTEVSDYDGVYTVDVGGANNGIVLSYDGGYTVPNVVLVPKTVSVTTYNSYHILWSVIPIMLLMIPVMLAVRAISGRD